MLCRMIVISRTISHLAKLGGVDKRNSCRADMRERKGTGIRSALNYGSEGSYLG